MPEPYRAAVYYAPERDDTLWDLGCDWLGGDPETGAALEQPDVPGIADATSDPRRYRFHATLKPPMRLAGGYDDFLHDVEALASRLRPFEMPGLRVADEWGFVALVPAAPCPALHAAAAACVTELDRYRVPEDAAKQARRAAGRSDSQLRNLRLWGYPYVLDDWRFHMTLSNAGAAGLLAPARRHFAPALTLPRLFRSLAVYIEATQGAAFSLATRIPLPA